MNRQSTQTLGILAIVVGLAGLALYAATFFPPAIASVQESGALAVLGVVLILLLIGGPILLGGLVFSFFSTSATPSQIAISVLYLAGFVITLLLARALNRSIKRWAIFSFIVPYIPPIILGVQAIRRAKVIRPTVRPTVQPRSQPAPAPAPARSSESAASTLFAQGQEFQWQGRYDEAIARYQQATRLEPNNAEIYKQMGICYIHMGWKDEAKACLDKAAQLDPKIAEEIKKK